MNVVFKAFSKNVNLTNVWVLLWGWNLQLKKDWMAVTHVKCMQISRWKVPADDT
jgi:hypothetical protein